MSEWIRAVLDLVLIGAVGAGLVQVARLIRSLADLRTGRVEMERFVREFNTTVVRAEAGVKGLRQAARETGDDLEKLVEKGSMLRDELQFIVESADQLAERLTSAASDAAKVEPRQAARAAADVKTEPQAMEQKTASPQPTSRAEKELMQALKKLN